jgi:hypothetical protein
MLLLLLVTEEGVWSTGADVSYPPEGEDFGGFDLMKRTRKQAAYS